ncbi:hypothetical protein J6590_079170 [Homalodisca vitripennis]|nr:hypothetical protein J6590_079170 [Homalodisca vitripennis]
MLLPEKNDNHNDKYNQLKVYLPAELMDEVDDRINSLRAYSQFALGQDIHGYETRGRGNYRTGRHRTAGVQFINKLPDFMKYAITLNASKTRLNHYLASNAFYSVNEFLAFNWQIAQLDD